MIRCAHFDGRWRIYHQRTGDRLPFYVCGGYGAGPHPQDGNHAANLAFDSEADAIAAFHAAEEALLAGGEA